MSAIDNFSFITEMSRYDFKNRRYLIVEGEKDKIFYKKFFGESYKGQMVNFSIDEIKIIVGSKSLEQLKKFYYSKHPCDESKEKGTLGRYAVYDFIKILNTYHPDRYCGVFDHDLETVDAKKDEYNVDISALFDLRGLRYSQSDYLDLETTIIGTCQQYVTNDLCSRYGAKKDILIQSIRYAYELGLIRKASIDLAKTNEKYIEGNKDREQIISLFDIKNNNYPFSLSFNSEGELEPVLNIKKILDSNMFKNDIVSLLEKYCYSYTQGKWFNIDDNIKNILNGKPLSKTEKFILNISNGHHIGLFLNKFSNNPKPYEDFLYGIAQDNAELFAGSNLFKYICQNLR